MPRKMKKPSSSKDIEVVSKKMRTDDDPPNWQATKTTVCERHAVLFNNDLMSDIKFLVGTDHIQAVPAHKFILATGSSVFYAMFYGSLAEKSSEIRLPDVQPSAFLALLKYLYCDEIQVDPDNVLSTLYISKKYLMPHLTKACIQYLIKKTLTADNACFLLDQSHIFDEPDFTKSCWNVIDTQTKSVIDSKGFLDVDNTTLGLILSRDTLNCREIDLFEATVKWADAACKKRKIKPTPQNRRDVIGQLLTLIRFPIMQVNEFADKVTHLEILTPDESNDIFRTLTSANKPNIFNFSTKHRGFNQGFNRRNFYDSSSYYY